jgi:lipoprotein releasing system ATP-binding protein
MKNDQIVLEVKNLKKEYKSKENNVIVFDDINFYLNKGDFVSLMGPSGIGKSTLLNILGTLDRPDKGEVLYNGRNPFQLSEKEKARFRNEEIGFVFQFHHLLPEFTALENVMMPAIVYRQRDNSVEKRARELLENVGLTHRIGHKPSEMSGGERQRVAVARSLINNPDVILADEPSGNLDLQNSKNLVDLLLQLNQEYGNTFIIATHNPDIAQKTEKVLIMEENQLTIKENIK